LSLVVAWHSIQAAASLHSDTGNPGTVRHEQSSVVLPDGNRFQIPQPAAVKPKAWRTQIWGTAMIAIALAGLCSYTTFKLSKDERTKTFEIETVREIDRFFAGKDEAGFQEALGVRNMLEINVRYETDRLRHFLSTGDREFAVGPYMDDATAMVDLGLAGTSAYPYGGTTKLDTNPRMVHLVIVPTSYSQVQATILKYQTSIGAPSVLIAPLKRFGDTLYENAHLVIAVFNEALQSDTNYYLMRTEGIVKYRYALDALYYQRYKPLRPQADEIRETARKAIAVQ
jgi:hypothetical protein